MNGYHDLSRKRLTALILAILIALGLTFLTTGGTLTAQVQTAISIQPDKAFYRPGVTVRLHIQAQGTRLTARITHLADEMSMLEATLNGGSAELAWTPPADAAPRGYGIEVSALDEGGQVLATASAAFDVLDRWTQAPRYGFLSRFEPGRSAADIEATMAALARYHVNGLQFYDWQYRHEQLLPPAGTDDLYADLLGKQMSLKVITALIDAAHAHNIAAMPYTAIYGASVGFYNQHPTWAFFERPGEPFRFGDNFLVIMNPEADSPWTAHLLNEYRRVLDETGFDGIHIDQYGAPKIGLNNDGERLEMADLYPYVIDETAKLVDELRGDDGAVYFNAVGNDPVETVAPANQDGVYVEVWSPYNYFMDLPRIIANAQRLGGDKPVIIAAYIPPENRTNALLADALVFGSGAYHLELGEPDAMLADPYFPKYGTMDADLRAAITRYYDFAVRYEDALALDTVNTAETRASALAIDGVLTESRRSRDRVGILVRAGKDREAFSLVNLMGITSPRWNQPANAPTPLRDLAVTLTVERPVKSLWWASPDSEDLSAHGIDYAQSGSTLTFRLPRLDYWTMLVVEYEAAS